MCSDNRSDRCPIRSSATCLIVPHAGLMHTAARARDSSDSLRSPVRRPTNFQPNLLPVDDAGTLLDADCLAQHT
jgi:hypothetical protein